MVEALLNRTVGLNWASRPYRAVVFACDHDDVAADCWAQGFLETIVDIEGGALMRITNKGLQHIGAELPFTLPMQP